MDFGDAVRALKAGKRVSREGLNGEGMWLILGAMPDDAVAECGYPLLPFIAMKTADDKMLPGWLASQSDMLAEDWLIVE